MSIWFAILGALSLNPSSFGISFGLTSQIPFQLIRLFAVRDGGRSTGQSKTVWGQLLRLLALAIKHPEAPIMDCSRRMFFIRAHYTAKGYYSHQYYSFFNICCCYRTLTITMGVTLVPQTALYMQICIMKMSWM